MENLETGKPEESSSGIPEKGPEGESGGTSQPNGEASQSATEGSSFIPEGVDINTLPPEVRSVVDKINKDMVRGFTEKTSKLSETTKSEVEKAVQDFKSKAEMYDQISSQDEFVKMWNEYVNKSSNGSQSENPEYDKVKAQVEKMERMMKESEIKQVTDSFAEAVDENGKKLHPDFDKLNEIVVGKKGNDEYSLLRIGTLLSEGTEEQKLMNGYKTAKAIYDNIFEAGRKAGIGRVQSKVKSSTFEPGGGSSESLSTTSKKPKNAHEAMEMARKGLVVSRD